MLNVDRNTVRKNPIWQALTCAQQQMATQNLSALFAAAPGRAQAYHLAVDGVYLDYSKHFVDNAILAELFNLAQACGLQEAISALFRGDHVNTTESRPALHVALRQDVTASPVMFKGENVLEAIDAQKQKMFVLAKKCQQGEWLGATGKVITDVVNLGIGGSDLGPRMALEALKPFSVSSLKIHCVSNIDPAALCHTLAHCQPETTLFLISSKSFNTPETLTNAQLAKEWLTANLKTDCVENHFIAITANAQKAQNFGINPAHILHFWEWVGGRYSLWSVIGFPLLLQIGQTHFEDFLQGAQGMDRHFKTAPLAENMPVLLALIGVWYINFWDASTLAVLPYAQGLVHFTDYLQQLDMESNGKRVKHNGEVVDHATGPVIWGQVGTNGQHAFYQLLHQGTHFIPVDFIVPLQSVTPQRAQHQQLVANALAQARGLMEGTQNGALGIHNHLPGNKPSSMILIPALTPFSLGQLLALYEHKVFVQSVIWEINAFDQPGVELGKQLASEIMHYLYNQVEVDKAIDPSTVHLIERARAAQK